MNNIFHNLSAANGSPLHQRTVTDSRPIEVCRRSFSREQMSLGYSIPAVNLARPCFDFPTTNLLPIPAKLVVHRACGGEG